jgi:hypothetical protein
VTTDNRDSSGEGKQQVTTGKRDPPGAGEQAHMSPAPPIHHRGKPNHPRDEWIIQSPCLTAILSACTVGGGLSMVAEGHA